MDSSTNNCIRWSPNISTGVLSECILKFDSGKTPLFQIWFPIFFKWSKFLGSVSISASINLISAWARSCLGFRLSGTPPPSSSPESSSVRTAGSGGAIKTASAYGVGLVGLSSPWSMSKTSCTDKPGSKACARPLRKK